MNRLLSRTALLALALNILFPSLLLGQEARFALVIGNGAYSELPRLTNPPNDARDVAAELKGLGFQTELLLDASLPDMEDAVVRLGNRLGASPGSTGFFYYAGHGVQSGGVNYLIPADARIPSESFFRTKALAAQTVLDTLQGAKNGLNVIVLDACRDNPFGWSRSGSRGLSVVGSQPPGSIIVYATSAGSVAQDGQGRNGVFTQELLKYLGDPGLEIKEVFNRTGAGVRAVTGGKQIPAVYNQFFDTVYLGRSASSGAVSGGSGAPQAEGSVSSALYSSGRTADLMLRASEEGAEVYVDGVKKGRAPLLLQGLPSERPLVVEARSATQTGRAEVTLNAGELRELSLTMKRLTGNLVVTSPIQGLRLVLDGEDRGPLGSGVLRELAVGDHSLELIGKDVYWTSKVEVPVDSTAQVEARPFGVGSLVIEAPEGAPVVVSGPGGTRSFSGPGSWERLQEGSYRVAAGGKGFFDASETVTVRKGLASACRPYATGLLAVRTQGGATCSLDGGPAVPVEAPFPVAPGTYALRVSKPGYRDFSQSVTVSLGRTTSLGVDLERLRPGKVSIDSRGAELNVFCDYMCLTGSPIADGSFLYSDIPAGVPVTFRLETEYAAAPLYFDLTLGEGQELSLEGSDYRAWLAGAFSAERDVAVKSLSTKRGRTSAGVVSLATGILGGAAAGALYYLGVEAGKVYDAAEDTASAQDARTRVELFQTLFPIAAAVGGAGFGLSPFFFAGGPDPKVLEASIRRLDEEIKDLGK